MDECLFCKIVAGQIPSTQVYEDADAYAFLDIMPFKPGHTLVVSKQHVPNALADAAVLAKLSPAIKAVGETLMAKLGADGLNIVTNVNEVSGQSVFHLHVHLIPRYADNPGFAAMVVPDADADLGIVADKLRA